MAKDPADNEINARPTKRLVAYVITKDIRLEDAILDLVDNAVDGARRVGSADNLSKFHVAIKFDKTQFYINDNCGGMSIELAQEYAFRFGRPEDYAPLDGSTKTIGNFGIGMKRALLKMGRIIDISSRTKLDYFEVRIDVDEWLTDDSSDKAWIFEFKKKGYEPSKLTATGTTIKVTSLYPGIAERFQLAEFETKLHLLIRDKQAAALSAGLSVAVNDKAVQAVEVTLLQSSVIKPIYKHASVPVGQGKVNAKLYAGVAEPNNERSGWNVICNGRTVLWADKTPVTGWGYKEGADSIPAYHHQYARFRGFVFFESDEPDLLPWNTTKTNVDAEHPLYRRYRLEMVAAMKDVFAFLNDLDKEKDKETRPLEEKLDKAKPVSLAAVKQSAHFVRPNASATSADGSILMWIRYQRPTRAVKAVMDSLGAETASEAGEMTFDLYNNTRVKGSR